MPTPMKASGDEDVESDCTDDAAAELIVGGEGRDGLGGHACGGLSSAMNADSRGNDRQKSKGNSKANTGILHCVQDDGVKQTTTKTTAD